MFVSRGLLSQSVHGCMLFELKTAAIVYVDIISYYNV